MNLNQDDKNNATTFLTRVSRPVELDGNAGRINRDDFSGFFEFQPGIRADQGDVLTRAEIPARLDEDTGLTLIFDAAQVLPITGMEFDHLRATVTNVAPFLGHCFPLACLHDHPVPGLRPRCQSKKPIDAQLALKWRHLYYHCLARRFS
jgi:hypothetical protein